MYGMNGGIDGAEEMPPPLTTQSPFADATALLQAAGMKQDWKMSTMSLSDTSSEAPRDSSERLVPFWNPIRSFERVGFLSRSFSELTDRTAQGSSRLSNCPALKVSSLRSG